MSFFAQAFHTLFKFKRSSTSKFFTSEALMFLLDLPDSRQLMSTLQLVRIVQWQLVFV